MLNAHHPFWVPMPTWAPIWGSRIPVPMPMPIGAYFEKWHAYYRCPFRKKFKLSFMDYFCMEYIPKVTMLVPTLIR